MFDFDVIIERGGTGSSKWSRYDPDVLPMWVADMDFAVAPCIQEALRARIEHPVFGYAVAQDSLRETLVAALARDYAWSVHPDEIVFLPGVEPGFNMAIKALLQPGQAVAVQTPAYPPILAAPGHWGLRRIDLPLALGEAGATVDVDALRAGLAQAGALLFCNPHNPSGKVFDRAELEAIAEACLGAGALIISDEIHADIVYDCRRHLPIASLSDAVARRAITLMAASKAYNIAGLKTAFAVIKDRDLRRAFQAARLGMVDSVNLFGLIATQAAYGEGAPWRRAVVRYLEDNRDYLVEQVAARRLPGVRLIRPQGGFLAWLDCSGTGLDGDPQAYFLQTAKVGLNPGRDFGEAYRAFVRLNFGCPRRRLEEGIARLQASLERV